jgi:uncharacterized circularly permuted ATP-grasp superfamily protein/uncharacterized alpha-E superfamily protein
MSQQAESAERDERGELSGLLADYHPVPGVFDELLNAAGKMRPHYDVLMRELDGLGEAGIKARRETGNRLIHEQGVTYNVYGDPAGMERPWRLDPIPFIISPTEWRALEKALIQRATLYNAILADCYGPQSLIRSGRLPPALVFAQPDFLRACHGIKPSHDIFLNHYGVDLARSPDGQWWVISDRTQIPTGAGYALENRLVTSRILHEPFRDCRVQRMAGFFRALRESLTHTALRHTDNPRVVLLTPGPYNETYFEQAYLARYLGYSLVEGQDLTVRDNRVFLKTLSGLEPVDVILRRVDDDFCDPLELRNDSMLGVPGLVEVLRAGNVVVANALGASLVQSPAFMAFLPGLCRHLLGEELKMPSVATWWGGQKPAADYVRKHLDELYMKPAFRSRPPAGLKGINLSTLSREEIERRMAFQPHLFVGQERVVLSTAPSWSGNSLTAAQVSVRMYLVASEGSYKVLPGGLTRVAAAGEAPQISMQRGGMSKDTWVLSDEPVEGITLLHSANQPIELRRVGNNLPSRVADNFFWLGRYAERAEASARLLRSALLRFSTESGSVESPFLLPLLLALERQGQLESLDKVLTMRDRPEALEAELLAAIFDEDRDDSLRSLIMQVQRIAVLLRDRLSSDTWRVVSQLDDRLTAPTSGTLLMSGEALAVLNQTIMDLAAFHGLAMENMTRAQGWRFLDIGHRIERSIYLCSVLRCALRSPVADNPSLLEALLEFADSSLTYRSRYNLLPHMAAVYDLVLLDDTNPRSLIFQLDQIAKHFEHLPREKDNALPSPGQRVMLETLTRLRLADPTSLGGHSADWRKSNIAEVIEDIAQAMPRLSDAIAVSYFAHSAVARMGLTGPTP